MLRLPPKHLTTAAEEMARKVARVSEGGRHRTTLVPTAGPQLTRLTLQYHSSNNNGFDAGRTDEKILDTEIKRIRVRDWSWT